MNWNVPWNFPWTGYPPSVYPATNFPGHVNGLGLSFNYNNTMPFQPPVLNPGVNGIHQNLPQPPITVAQPSQQAPTVAPPIVNRGSGGGAAQPSTSASAPRQVVDSVPSRSLVCSDTYNFIVVFDCVVTELGGPWGELFYALPPHSPVFIFYTLINRGVVSGLCKE